MNFNFNSAFKPMGFPGMPQMHFPSGSGATPPQPMIPSPMPQQAFPPMQGNQGSQGNQGPAGQMGHGYNFGGYRDAMKDWRQQMPSLQSMFPGGLTGDWRSHIGDMRAQMNGPGSIWSDWKQGRPQISDYRGMLPSFNNG